VVIAGSGPLLLAVAANLKKKGALIAGVFEQAPLAMLVRFGATLAAQPGKLVEGAQYRIAMGAVPFRTSAWVTRARGDKWLESVTVSVNNEMREVACDYLACGFHLVPNLELPRLLGCDVRDGYVCVDGAQESSAANVYCAGELTGIGGLEKALVEGEIAGLAVADRNAAHLHARRDRTMRFARRLDAAFALRPELRELADADTIVCRCEDVRRGALAGLHSGREAKLHTRCGMGACQGRICGPATSFLFGWESESTRPPISPARIESVAAPLEKADVIETAR
jgi:NADPH-dependent 2,4-dienoyl-CoA reductase/sulfur reductase-like enzyme